MISFVLDRYLDDGYGYGGCVGPFFLHWFVTAK
jgi:hypothetical protein